VSFAKAVVSLMDESGTANVISVVFVVVVRANLTLPGPLERQAKQAY